MSSDLEAIRRVVEAFDRTDWQEVDVRSGTLRVHLVADGDPVPLVADGDPVPLVADADPVLAPDPREPEPAPMPSPAPPPGAHVVTSPSPGIFWRAPEPGAPPFTDVGNEVSPSTTLCIIEVMKLMSHLKAGLTGTVAAVLVDNGVAVAKDQPLFAIIADPGHS